MKLVLDGAVMSKRDGETVGQMTSLSNLSIARTPLSTDDMLERKDLFEPEGIVHLGYEDHGRHLNGGTAGFSSTSNSVYKIAYKPQKNIVRTAVDAKTNMTPETL